jgi:hypothetical protein
MGTGSRKRFGQRLALMNAGLVGESQVPSHPLEGVRAVGDHDLDRRTVQAQQCVQPSLRANVIGKGEVSVCFPAAVLQLLYWDSRSLHSAGDRSVCMKATFLRLGNWSPYGTLVAACSGQRIANSELLTMGNPTV